MSRSLRHRVHGHREHKFIQRANFLHPQLTAFLYLLTKNKEHIAFISHIQSQKTHEWWIKYTLSTTPMIDFREKNRDNIGMQIKALSQICTLAAMIYKVLMNGG